MKIYFYQANFCSECGNEMKPRSSWGPRYFCDDCARQIGRGGYVKPLLALVFATTLVVSALHRTDPPKSISSLPTAPVETAVSAPVSAPVSAMDATAVQQPEFKAAPATAQTLCGARTKKGTPCKHRAAPGQRCAQHQGMKSMIDESSAANAHK
jgi:hypothetical protein